MKQWWFDEGFDGVCQRWLRDAIKQGSITLFLGVFIGGVAFSVDSPECYVLLFCSLSILALSAMWWRRAYIYYTKKFF
jgi:hypothetical protein